MALTEAWLAAGCCVAASYYLLARAAWRLPRQRIFIEGRFDSGRRWARLAALLWGKRFANRFLIPALEYSGRTAEAVERADRWATRQLGVGELGACVNALINGGRYRRALDIARALETRGREHPEWALVQVNVAEAEHNVGQSLDALARLQRLGPLHGFTAAAAGMLKGWVLAELARGDEALEAASHVALDAVPRIFRAELWFTRAAALLAAQRPAAALEAADAGCAAALRASSERNGAFLRARCLAASGDVTAALFEFQRGAELPYRGQGGAALLAWGDLLLAQGQAERARAAWQLAIERDPESAAATAAAARGAASERLAQP